MNRFKGFLVVAAVVGSSATAFAASDVKIYGTAPSDSDITVAVRAKIKEFPELAAPNEVRIRTLHRVVYLYGQVDTVLERNQAESAAAQIPGVKKVVDTINLAEAGG